MSSHPNVVLACILVPNGDTKAAAEAIVAETPTGIWGGLEIYGNDYSHAVLPEYEDSPLPPRLIYDESSQISAPEGSIIVYRLVTYGYGETVEWDQFDKERRLLDAWAQEIEERHDCTRQIIVAANYS